jgi:hypothetical protein
MILSRARRRIIPIKSCGRLHTVLLRLVQSTHTVIVLHALIIRAASRAPGSTDAFWTGLSVVADDVGTKVVVAVSEVRVPAGLPNRKFGWMWVATEGGSEEGKGIESSNGGEEAALSLLNAC